ncbi:MAG: alginate lyase family protein [Armatimonadota bacterium]
MVVAIMAVWMGVSLPAFAAGDAASLTAEPTTEAQFFALLDYSLPHLSTVKRAVDAGNYAKAKIELLAAMRTRRKPINTVNWYGMGTTSTLNWCDRPSVHDVAYDTSVADRICRGIYAGEVISAYPDYKMGSTTDWSANPYNAPEWTWVLNRHPNWVYLGRAYWATGNEKYARRFNNEVVDWVSNRPVPPDGSYQSSPSWRTIEAGIRMFFSWPLAYEYFLQSPSFTVEAHYLMMRSMVDHGRHLMAHPTGGNWVTMEMDGLVHLGTLFPEFKEASTWRKFGMDRLALEIKRQIYPDGFQFELSTSYHQVVMCCFGDAYEMLTANGLTVPAGYKIDMEKLYDPILYTVKPSGTLPAPNDSDEHVEGVVLPFNVVPEPAPDPMHVLKQGAELFQREDMKYVASRGAKGKRPADTSHDFPYAGYCVMRSGWDINARYLFFDAGPFGAGHQHEDKLNLELYAYGKSLLFDSGADSYAASSYRSYCLATVGHNTAIIDGQGQNRRLTPAEERDWVVNKPVTNPWISNAGFDYVSGVYSEGYGPDRDKSVAHRRQVLFVKPDYWIVLDDFQGRGSHEIDTLWHLRPGKHSLDTTSGACMTANPGEANLLVLPASNDGLSVNVVEGQIDPVAGWISITFGEVRLAAPEAIYSWTGDLPKTQGWLLYPTPQMLSKQPIIEALDVVGGGPGQTAYKVNLANGRADYVLLTKGMKGLKKFGNFQTDAEIAIVRLSAQGRILKTSIDGGTFVRRIPK